MLVRCQLSSLCLGVRKLRRKTSKGILQQLFVAIKRTRFSDGMSLKSSTYSAAMSQSRNSLAFQTTVEFWNLHFETRFPAAINKAARWWVDLMKRSKRVVIFEIFFISGLIGASFRCLLLRQESSSCWYNPRYYPVQSKTLTIISVVCVR